MLRFWKSGILNVKHFLSHIVYWEYIRQFDPKKHAQHRTYFKNWVDGGAVEFLSFGKPEAEMAMQVYLGVKESLPPNTKGKDKLRDMHCDIMIASTAHSRGKRVLLQKIDDEWLRIRSAVKARGLGELRILDKKDLEE